MMTIVTVYKDSETPIVWLLPYSLLKLCTSLTFAVTVSVPRRPRAERRVGVCEYLGL